MNKLVIQFAYSRKNINTDRNDLAKERLVKVAKKVSRVMMVKKVRERPAKKARAKKGKKVKAMMVRKVKA